MRWIVLLLVSLATGCASMGGHADWWSVRTVGSGRAAAVHSTSHVNHGKPPADVEVQPRLLREEKRGNVSVALQYDAVIADAWSGSAWKVHRELDKALDWLERLAGPRGARLVLTLVDDAQARDVARVHAGEPLVVDLVVAVGADTDSQSAVVGRALATALHEAAHALSAQGGPADRFADEHAAALVEACYLVDTLRPGDALSLRIGTDHAPTDNYAIQQSRAAAGAVVRELRTLVRAGALRADDAGATRRVFSRCGIGR